MLIKFIRTNKKIIFTFILALMLIPFLFWGIGSIGEQPVEKKEPVKVHGKSISVSKLNEAVLDSQILLLVDFVESNNIKNVEQFDLYKDWYNQLVTQIDFSKIAIKQLILVEEANKFGLSASKSELANWIGAFPLFLRNNVFDINIYNNIVANYFHTIPARFEKAIQQILATKKLQKLITDTVLTSDSEIYEAYKDKNEKAAMFYIEFNTADYLTKVGNLENKELEDYYQSRKQEFTEPEKIKISYMLFDPATFKGQIIISEKEIEDYYREHKSEFSEKEDNDLNPKNKNADENEKVELSDKIKEKIKQMLADQKSQELCQQKALEISIILTEEKKLGDMLKLAKEKGLTIKETPYIPKGQVSAQSDLTPQILQSAWRMELTSISDVLPAGNKWVIISPEEKKQSYIPEFTEINEKIKDILKNKKAEELAVKTAQEYFERLPKNAPFAKAAKSLGLKVKKSKLITRSNELFSLTTKVVKTNKGAAIVSLKNIQHINKTMWEKEKDNFAKTYTEQKKRQFFQNWLTNIAKS